jgi:hypothetical protein
MAKRLTPESIKKRIADDLFTLVRVLQDDRSGVVVNPEVLKSAANQILRGSEKKFWSYQVADLQLKVDIPQKVFPENCGKWLNIHIDLDLKGRCDNKADDCLTDLVLQIKIETDTQQNVCSWHFDRHIGDSSDVQGEAHPLYHFQHGGHAMKDIHGSLGRTLLLSAPRLAFPPMDAVLSLDFVLSNFAGPSWQGLRDESAYVRLLQDSQKLYWQPYIKQLASWWDLGPKNDRATIQALWPHLI